MAALAAAPAANLSVETIARIWGRGRAVRLCSIADPLAHRPPSRCCSYAASIVRRVLKCTALSPDVFLHGGPPAGCGQHSPVAQQQQEVLRRRLQQLRANDAEKQKQQQQPASGGAGSKPAGSSSSSSGGGVGPRELRVGAVYQLEGVSSRDARVIEQQLVPAAIKVLQKFLQVGAWGGEGGPGSTAAGASHVVLCLETAW